MTDSWDWPTVRAETIRKFRGETPGAKLEQDIIDAFTLRPRTVLTAIDQITATLIEGKDVRSPWAMLRFRCQDAGPVSDTTASDESEKAKRVKGAKTWIRNAGLYCDRWDEDVQPELFGLTGPLKPYAADLGLVAELKAFWLEQRPRGERAERESEEWQESVRQHRVAAEQRLKHKPVPEWVARMEGGILQEMPV